MLNDALSDLPYVDLRSAHSMLFALMRFIYRGLPVIVMALLFSAQRSASAAARQRGRLHAVVVQFMIRLDAP
jgi:hypothetical protein